MSVYLSFRSKIDGKGGIRIYDLLIKNGMFLLNGDGRESEWKPMDAAVADGKIVMLREHTEGYSGEEMEANTPVAAQVIDASGCYVTPGLIDYHMHYFKSGSELGILPEITAYANGVTAVVDGGSAGVSNFDGFYLYDMAGSTLTTKALLNVCSVGQPAVYYLENMDPSLFQEEKILGFCRKYEGTIVGLKVRQSREIVGDLGLEPTRRAVEIAEKAGLPVVVHATDSPGEIRDTLKILRPGDVFCHCFHQKGKTILDSGGKVLPEVWEAQKRGVLFDMAHGSMNFSYSVASAAISQGFLPDIVSSDLSTLSAFKPPAYGMAYMISELMNLGMNFAQIIRRCTEIPAGKIEMPELGNLHLEGPADISIFRISEKEISYHDRYGNTFTGKKFLEPLMTVKSGKVMYRQYDFL